MNASRRTTWVFVAMMLAVACACEQQREPRYVPAQCERDKMADWILSCIEKANPYSDEEPEDNTRQCERTAVPLFCGEFCYVNRTGQYICQVQEEEAPP